MIEHIVKAGVGVIVRSLDCVLIGKRKGSHGSGLWSFPGGHIDSTDTSLKQCGEREVFEETGIVCNVFYPDGIREDLFTTFHVLSDDGSKRYVTSYLIADYVRGGVPTGLSGVVPLEPEKCEQWRFVTLDELRELTNTDANRTWMPVDQVIYYLEQLEMKP